MFRRVNLLESRSGRRLLFTALYLSEGAPIGYIWWALPTTLRSAGVPVDRITHMTASLTLVWALKFVWAPLVDTMRSPRWGLRNWIALTQICMGLALIPLVLLPPTGDLGLTTVILFIHALFASTQDASVDALCIAATSDEERGRVNGWMQVGMLLGRALFGGAALYAERWVGQRGILLCLLLVIWSSTLMVVFMTREPSPVAAATVEAQRPSSILERLGRAFRRRTTWLALAFAGLGGAAFEATGAVAGPLLIDRNLPRETVGVFFALPVVVGTGLGAMAGGWLSDRIGRARAVACLTAAIAVDVAALAGAHAGGVLGTTLVLSLLSVLYLLYGAFAASSYAMFMDITDPSLGATQFSAFMGATNLCEVWATSAVGRLVTASDYGTALPLFAMVSLASVPVVLCLRALPPAARAMRCGAVSTEN